MRVGKKYVGPHKCQCHLRTVASKWILQPKLEKGVAAHGREQNSLVHAIGQQPTEDIRRQACNGTDSAENRNCGLCGSCQWQFEEVVPAVACRTAQHNVRLRIDRSSTKLKRRRHCANSRWSKYVLHPIRLKEPSHLPIYHNVS